MSYGRSSGSSPAFEAFSHRAWDSSDPSAHDAMSITDSTASSCSITKGLAAKIDTMARDPADRCASSAPGAAGCSEALSRGAGGQRSE